MSPINKASCTPALSSNDGLGTGVFIFACLFDFFAVLAIITPWKRISNFKITNSELIRQIRFYFTIWPYGYGLSGLFLYYLFLSDP